MAQGTTNYTDRIVFDSKVLLGKPVVKGTRIPVELVLAHLAENPDTDDLLAAYPRLRMRDVKACLAYASRLVEASGLSAGGRRRRASSRA